MFDRSTEFRHLLQFRAEAHNFHEKYVIRTFQGIAHLNLKHISPRIYLYIWRYNESNESPFATNRSRQSE